MNRLLIYEYINRLRREDIIKFSNMKGIKLENNELDVIYYYVKKEYKRFFNNPMEVLREVKGKVSENTFREIMQLYDKYKTKIS